MNRTTIFLGDADRDAIRLIRERWGVGSDSAAMRLALRVVAGVSELEGFGVPPVRPTSPPSLAGDGGSGSDR